MESDIQYEFQVLEPEFAEACVPGPQLVVMQLDIKTVQVTVYFMENTAVHIESGWVSSGMGVVSLGYFGMSPGGIVRASISLRKLAYTFKDAQGMARKFEFKGNRHP